MNDPAARALVIVVDPAVRSAWCAAASACGMLAEGVDGPVAAIGAARRPGLPAPTLAVVDQALPGMGPALLLRALRSIPGLDGVMGVVAGATEVPAGLVRAVACPAPAALAGVLSMPAAAPAAPAAPAVPVPPPGPATTTGEPVLDREVVERVRSYGEDMFQNLVGTYLSELPGRIDQMAAHAAGGDLKAAGGIAHALKGSSGSLGLRRLWQACSEYDRLCRAGGGDLAASLATVKAEAGAATTAMRAELARRP